MLLSGTREIRLHWRWFQRLSTGLIRGNSGCFMLFQNCVHILRWTLQNCLDCENSRFSLLNESVARCKRLADLGVHRHGCRRRLFEHAGGSVETPGDGESRATQHSSHSCLRVSGPFTAQMRRKIGERDGRVLAASCFTGAYRVGL